MKKSKITAENSTTENSTTDKPIDISEYQQHILNFYDSDTIVPFVPIVAMGPWIVTSDNSVVYDVGGYGMLGFGHNPSWCLPILGKPHVMANIMTPSRIQPLYTNLLRSMIGSTRPQSSEKEEKDEEDSSCPYSKFAFLNSGSEAMELVSRILDTDTPDDSVNIVLTNSFHGRTPSAALLSDSCSSVYQQHVPKLVSNKKDTVYTVGMNNYVEFVEMINHIRLNNKTIRSVFMEPIMGEGNPGIHVSSDFYKLVREYTQIYNIPLVIDSVHAGLRGTGYLSACDYPWLRTYDPPDIEIFSKAIFSGQYPLSLVGLSSKYADKFQTGTYGNTMTGNPKALEISYETLRRVNPSVITNIQEKGKECKDMLYRLQRKFPDIVTHVTGTGLLLALHIHPNHPVVDSEKGVELICRNNGLLVIHGGENALRLTPHFLISSKEITLLEALLEMSLQEIRDSLFH